MLGKGSLNLSFDIHLGKLQTSEQVLSLRGADSDPCGALEGLFPPLFSPLSGLCSLIKIGVLEKENMNSEYSNKLYPCLGWN